MIILKSKREIAHMRAAGRLAAEVLEMLAPHVKPGVTTAAIDRLADDFIAEHGGVATFKGYRGFPASICASPNDAVIHGIPDDTVLKEGDIFSVDVGVTLEGFVGDHARTYAVGAVSEKAQQLLDATQRALQAGIAAAQVGNRASDIGAAVQAVVEAEGFSSVREYVGHGVGRSMHEEPEVPMVGPAGHGARLKNGMVVAIEPMINMGTWRTTVDDNGWTVRTKDGQWSAHFEHTVAITDDGPQILTVID